MFPIYGGGHGPGHHNKRFACDERIIVNIRPYVEGIGQAISASLLQYPCTVTILRLTLL